MSARSVILVLPLIALGACATSESGPAATGTSGTSGGAGTSGAAGTSGDAGTTGVAGTMGGAGTSGAAGTSGGVGTTGGGGTTGAAGRAGNAGTTGVAGRGGTTGAAGTTGGGGGTAGTTGRAGSGGAGGGSSGATGACAPCGTHRWACWPMPNPASTGQPNPASYRDNGDGTVTDNITCLTWQKTASSTKYTVAAGRTACAGLGAGWRLATRVELASVNDFTLSGSKFPTPLAGPSGFFKTGSEWVLTTKQIGAGAGTDFGWAYNFSDGIVSNARSGATADYVRCVRGGGDADYDTAPGALAVAPPNQYTAVATGEVRDNYTGLVWQQDYSPATMAWTDAAGYCAGLTTGGHTWRVPSLRELATLVDEAQVAPAINRTMFPNTKSGSKSNNWYWASHRAAGSATAAWAINFDDGFTGFNAGASGDWNYFTAAWVKCVR